ncbi:hypothetical protein ACJMK2_029860 [Sinanodonta woodiana]|uniref:Uncharacterized protein n=1 Tax=Sinanodonta woodiana TaxID=1069815 RepID=A0ABD3XFD6_SINWO
MFYRVLGMFHGILLLYIHLISTLAIQLYCAQKTDLTDYVIRELETNLRRQHGMKLQMQMCLNVSSIQSCIPLIVICLSSSRLGVDMSAAVSGLPTGPNTAVLIFHHKKPHALPTEPSNAVLKEDEFKNIGIIIDVAFFENMGLYDCDMNTRAYKSLISFIKAHGTM